MPVVTITANYDGYVAYYIEGATYTKYDTQYWLDIGYMSAKGISLRNRPYIRFPLTNLPSGSTVNQVRLGCRNETAGGVAHLTDIHAYHTNGQTDPEPDSALDAWNRAVSGNLYIDDSTDLRTTGVKWFTLPAQANTDVQNAKSAVNRFSLGLHEEGDDDLAAQLEAVDYAGANPPQLEITYTPPPPPPWGGSALPQLEMAKAILGLNYLPWSKRFPKIVPRTL